MKKEIKKLWVDALRSGEFTQTTTTLRDKNGFCCLGVLCELHRRTFQCGEDWIKTRYLGESEILPELVRDWSGLMSRDPETRSGLKLSFQNDTGKDFNWIANLIENDLTV